MAAEDVGEVSGTQKSLVIGFIEFIGFIELNKLNKLTVLIGLTGDGHGL